MVETTWNCPYIINLINHTEIISTLLIIIGSPFHILEGLISVKSQVFIDNFKVKFAEVVLSTWTSDDLKYMEIYPHPLRQLIEINNGSRCCSKFIYNLIELTLEKITISEKDIFEDTFVQPTKSTFIYSVLFNNGFQTLPIYEKVVQQMDIMWSYWEELGLRANYINAWENHNLEQRKVANDMWNVIQVTKRKQCTFETILEEARKELNIKKNIYEMIQSCTYEYCQKANDRDYLTSQISSTLKRLVTDPVRSVEIPLEILELAKYAGELIPYSKCQLWQNFLANHQSSNATAISKEIGDDGILLASTESCYSILKLNAELFHTFINNLICDCSKWESLPISQSSKLFPNMHNDLETLKDKFNDDVTEFFTMLFDYSKDKSNINYFCQGCINFFDLFQIQVGDNKHMFNEVQQIHENTVGKTFLRIYQTFRKHVYDHYSTKINKIFYYYGLAIEVIKFLYQLSPSDVDNLRETVNDWDETSISTKAVLDLVTLKTFLDQLSDRMKTIAPKSSSSITLDQVVIVLEDLLKDAQSKTVFDCFESSHLLLPSIQHIYMNLTNRRLSKRRQILNIMKNVSFSFKSIGQQERKQTYDLYYSYGVTINFDELADLRDRARLIEHSNRIKAQNDIEKDTEILHSFVYFVDTIENVIRNLTQIDMVGYPCTQFLFKSARIFTCVEGEYNELIEFEKEIEKLRIEWEYHLCELYKEHISLTYFFYHQVWSAERYLHEGTLFINNTYHLLKYIGIQPELIQYNFQLDMNEDPVNRLRKIGQLLSMQQIAIRTTDKHKHLTHDKVLLIQTSNEGIMRAILSLFTFTQIPAKANKLFYCTKRTTWVEIRAFAYRCVYSKTFHILIRPELLTPPVQDKFIELLHQMISSQPDCRLKFGIITTSFNINQQLINSLRVLELIHEIYDLQMLSIIELRKEIEKLHKKNCFLVTSNIAGLGKSTTIQNMIQNSGREYIKLTISGNINMETLLLRFSSYTANPSSSSNIAIHIDIGIIHDIDQLNEFLYSIILFRCFRSEFVAINIDDGIPIYIELDSSPEMTDKSKRIIILQNLEEIKISRIDWKQMNIQHLPGIQLIVKYLQTIDENKINQIDIDDQQWIDIDTTTCSKRLRKEFIGEKNDEQISWTRIKILVTIYHYLFSSFSKCGYFRSEFTKNSSLRMDILKHLLKSSDQFTSWSVESIRKIQRSTSNNNDLKLDEAIIRWDRLQPFTVIFTDSNDPLFVYKKSDDVPHSLIDEIIKTAYPTSVFDNLLSFFRSNIEEKKRQQELLFPDHSKLMHLDFFIRLASLSTKYFAKSVCNVCFKQHEYTDELCVNCGTRSQLHRPIERVSEKGYKYLDIKEFQLSMAKLSEKEYVWTADNYIKALLIYLRVQCRLPVILIGETGNMKYLCYFFFISQLVSFCQ